MFGNKLICSSLYDRNEGILFGVDVSKCKYLAQLFPSTECLWEEVQIVFDELFFFYGFHLCVIFHLKEVQLEEPRCSDWFDSD